MAVKQISTRVAIVGRGANCKGGRSAVEKASYISRTTLQSQYDGNTYYPKYSEDLVHSEIMLPSNAPPEYQDRATLWNAVELCEKKNAKAQLARSYRIEIPNEWSYELATEVMRDYVKRNFVSAGMCADFAIHDSENPKTHQRNLHCHILLTMRPILEDGSWGDKQKKVYELDKDGNKIRKKNGQYKCTTKDVTGWNSKDNAKRWRKDLADTVNAVNEKEGFSDNFWEYRSFKEQGLDILPQIHLGERASALERMGIQTERGEINRSIIAHNKMIDSARYFFELAKAKVESLNVSQTVNAVAGEVAEVIRRIGAKRGTLALPIVKGKYLRRVTDREKLQDVETALSFIASNRIESFTDLADFKKKRVIRTDDLEIQLLSRSQKIKRLKQITALYAEVQPLAEVYRESQKLKGIRKAVFDKKNEDVLMRYSDLQERMRTLMQDGNKIAPKEWNTEIRELSAEVENLKEIKNRIDIDLAFSEVIEHNRSELDRLVHNEAVKHSRQRNVKEL